MSLNSIWLGRIDNELLLPMIGRKFSEENQEISRTGRTASGRLVKDIIAVKKVFKLTYDMIDNEDILTFETIYGWFEELSLIVVYPTETKTYTVMMKPLAKERIIALGGGLWGNVNVELEEV